jgi:hypothetical protein
MLAYSSLAVEFLLRRKFNAPFSQQIIKFGKGQRLMSKKMQCMISGMSFCIICIFIRLAFYMYCYQQL